MIRDNKIRNYRISKDAYLLGDAAKHLPEIVALQLFEAVSHILAAPNSVVLRHAKLGLVVDMIRSGTGEFPKYEEYDQLRAERAELFGENWPSSTTLCETYFGWLYVVRAAMEIHLGRGNVARRPHLGSFENAAYTRLELDNAIRQCRDEIGFWPTQWEYSDWAYFSRQLGWDRGITPRIPGIEQYRNKCGSFDEAVQALAVSDDGIPPDHFTSNPENNGSATDVAEDNGFADAGSANNPNTKEA